MATAREQKSQEKELGTVGKFTDESFFRKSPAKPYDRPPTALRTSWILKLVDPAHRLISSGSQMLFSSVFRNFPHYLTSRASSQESSQSRKDDKKADGKDPFKVQVATNVVDNWNRSDRFGMMELEKTLKQKTFTRSEIHHLTTLLHSRNVDLPVVNEEKRFEFIYPIPESKRNRDFVKVPKSEVKMGKQLISTPILSSSVLDEDISSPAEIARAYMGSKQPKVCPSMRSLQSQGLRENSAGPINIPFSSKSTDMLPVPSSTNQDLKRRSSFFNSHFGSTVPLRRIRRKPNIHLSKGLSLPVSTRPICLPVSGLSFDASRSSKFGKVQHFPSSIRNSQLSLKPKNSFARKFIVNVESDKNPGAGCSAMYYTPSRSYKMASKILEHLDKFTPPKMKVSRFDGLHVGGKSPHELSPLTVGEHLRRMKNVDLPISEEFVHDDKHSNSLHGIPYHDNRDRTFQNKEKLENIKPLDPHGSIGSSKDSMNDLGVPGSAMVKSTIQPPKNKPVFQMWPDKDSADHVESSADRVAPASAEVREDSISFAVRQTTANEALAPAKSQTTSEVIVESLLNSSDLKTSDNSIDDDINIRFSLRNASSLCATSQPEIIDTAPTVCCENKDLPGNDQIDSPDFRFGNNLSPQKQPNASSTAFDADGAPYPDTQCKPASSYSDIQESVHLNADTSSNCKLDYSLRTCNNAFSSSASISAGLEFSFSSSACNQSLNHGASISCPSQFSSYGSPIVSMSQISSTNILSAISASNCPNITSTDNHPSTINLASSSSPFSVHNANDAHFNSISTPENSHYSIFSFGAAATPSSVNNQLNTHTVISTTQATAQEVSAGNKLTANLERTSMILGSSNVPSTEASVSFIFPTNSAAVALSGSSSKPVLSNSHPQVSCRVSSGDNDCEEQGISKDNVALFSQKSIPLPSSGFSFGPATSELSPFQVGKQQTLAEPPNYYPYNTSSSGLEAKAGSSFSLTAGGRDKANRRFLKIKRKK